MEVGRRCSGDALEPQASLGCSHWKDMVQDEQRGGVCVEPAWAPVPFMPDSAVQGALCQAEGCREPPPPVLWGEAGQGEASSPEAAVTRPLTLGKQDWWAGKEGALQRTGDWCLRQEEVEGWRGSMLSRRWLGCVPPHVLKGPLAPGYPQGQGTVGVRPQASGSAPEELTKNKLRCQGLLAAGSGEED